MRLSSILSYPLATAFILICADATSPALSSVPIAGDSKVTVGSPLADFPRNDQNEPGLALDPTNPSVIAAGANDSIDQAPCSGSRCPSIPGVGGQGVYFSFDGGTTWTQPIYSGWSARGGTAGVGPISTVPNYYENSLVSASDPTLAFGPRPGSHGFSWSNGSRLYYSNITTHFPGTTAFAGVSAIAVSYTDDLVRAAAGDASAWSAPVLVSKQNATTGSDKEALWVDNAASSPFFGNVYECDDGNESRDPGSTAPQPVVFNHSTDGGVTWTHQKISPAADALYAGSRFGGRTGCAIRTDSTGTVYVFWAGVTNKGTFIFMTRSVDGGAHFPPPRAVVPIGECGAPDPVSGFGTFDGVAGARTASLPSVDIANGAPDGEDASDVIALADCDATGGLNHEQALLWISRDHGNNWSAPMNVAAPGDRPDLPSVALSPNGRGVYVEYEAFLAPWQTDTSAPRPVQGVVRHSDLGNASLGPFADLHRGATGDARGSSRRTLNREFIYDYISIEAARSGAVALWIDARNAVDCPAIDAYRESFLTANPLPPPAPNADCPAGFGNLDIYGGFYLNPTP